jgi:signal transduction histidine kinase
LIWVQYQPDLAYRNVISGFSALAFVSAVAVAILRYHLYDIDVVVNRTIVYGALAAFITGVYVAVVVGVGSVVSSVGGSGLFLPILATALVGVVFQPVRGRLQAVANRLVYGTRATPYEVLSELTRRVAMVEAGDDLLPRMARILAEACAAVDAQVWLVVDGHPQLAGAWPLDAAVPPAPRIELGSPRAAAARYAVPVHHAGELLGVLTVSPRPGEGLTPRERTLVAELGLQAGLVLQNIRLESELRAHVDELRASRARIIQAEDLERRRIERDLHDGAQQRLVLLAYSLGMARARFGTRGDVELRKTLDEAVAQAQLALAELRSFARGIHPAILTEAGLGPALQSLAERSPVPATVDGDVIGRLPAPVEATAYFVVCEALANVARHAEASAVAIHVARHDGRLVVEVADDGVGGAAAERGSGLRGLADRVLVVNGRFEVHSPPGGGTRLVAEIPCAC